MGRGGDIVPCTLKIITWMEVTKQCQAPAALSSEKELPVLTEYEGG
jgi:hypothetical protein